MTRGRRIAWNTRQCVANHKASKDTYAQIAAEGIRSHKPQNKSAIFSENWHSNVKICSNGNADIWLRRTNILDKWQCEHHCWQLARPQPARESSVGSKVMRAA